MCLQTKIKSARVSTCEATTTRRHPQRTEVFAGLGKRLGNLGCGHHKRAWQAVGAGLAHGHDVWDNVRAAQLEAPHVGAHAAEAHLHLVGDAHASGRAHRLMRAAEISSRRNHLAAAAEYAFAIKCAAAGGHAVIVAQLKQQSFFLIILRVAHAGAVAVLPAVRLTGSRRQRGEARLQRGAACRLVLLLPPK